MKHSIFISYRRDDGIDTAQLLSERLKIRFGSDAVFLDTSSIEPGEAYPERLETVIKDSEAIIAMIGKHWQGNNDQGMRLANENDWVRKELILALADSEKKVFPVFIKGASARLAFQNLPPELSRIADFHSIELREKDFISDLGRLEAVLADFLPDNDLLEDLPLSAKYAYPEAPYKGLEFFREEDARVFFGRNSEIRKLFIRVTNANVLLLYGQSGCGKSSLLFAGLKPRLESMGWSVKYIRRDKDIDLGHSLRSLLSSSKNVTDQLVILDQVEEVFTNPAGQHSARREMKELLATLTSAKEQNCRVILGFRKEYLPEIEQAFIDYSYENDFKPKKMFLEPLKHNGVLEAIRGVTQSRTARDNYGLEFDSNDLPGLIAKSVMIDEESHIAPLLQMLLVQMWNEVKASERRVFTKKLLDRAKAISLQELVERQVSKVGESLPNDVASGAVLDTLYFFTTVRGTSAYRTNEELADHYRHLGFERIITALRNNYLLSETSEEGACMIRLAHDALAPIVRELHSQSDLPGPSASRVLESKRHDIHNQLPVEFSNYDLEKISVGTTGMRKLSAEELEVVNANQRRVQQEEADKSAAQQLKLQEEIKKELQNREIESVKVSFSEMACELLVADMEAGGCILLHDDMFGSINRSIPPAKSVYDDLITEGELELVYDDRSHLVNAKKPRLLRRFKELVVERYRREDIGIEMLTYIANTPFSAYLNIGYNDRLERLFQQLHAEYHFSYCDIGGGNSIDYAFGINLPLVYNLLGKLADASGFPITDVEMNSAAEYINDSTILQNIKGAMSSTRSIFILDVNWDAWYVQTIIRLLKKHFSDDALRWYTTRDYVTAENVKFLKNIGIECLDVDTSTFIESVFIVCSRREILRH